MSGDAALLLDVVRDLRDETRRLREDVQVNTATIAALRQKQEQDDALKRLVSRYLPWLLAALGFGGAGTAIGAQINVPTHRPRPSITAPAAPAPVVGSSNERGTGGGGP